MLEIAPLVMALQILLASEVAQPAAATISVTVPVPAQSLATALGLANPDPSTLMLRIIRHVYGAPDARARRLHETLIDALAKEPSGNVSVRVPLNPQIWQEAILHGRAESNALMPAILKDRAASLVYFGLSAVDDETLLWLSGHPQTLEHLRKNADVFAAFGRSLHIRNGHVAVPGANDASSAWQAVLGADPAVPDAFIERLIAGNGRLALLYDTVEHLDGPHQRFALSLQIPGQSRAPHLRALLQAFTLSAPDWRIPERPFSKPPIDGAILLSTIRVTSDGNLVRPATMRFWDRVFRGDALNDVPFERVSDGQIAATSGSLPLDPAWLADRILRVPYAIGRRRLDALLFVQRVFSSDSAAESAGIATVARAYLSYPALMISLERTGITDSTVYVQAAEHAQRLNTIQPVALRKAAIAGFQSAVAVIERAHRARTIDDERAAALLTSLSAIEVSGRGYEWRFAAWLRDQLIRAFPKRDSAEETLLSAIAGVSPDSTRLPVIEWEGRRYRVELASAELRRLQLVRERQGAPTLDAALAAIAAMPSGDRSAGASDEVVQQLAGTLMSIVYAIYLGDPEGAAVTSGNVALRHDFGFPAGTARGSGDAWSLPMERFDNRTAWRVRGSLLGLEAALSRLTLRRIDRTDMPGEPTLGSQDRQTIMLTAALLDPFALSDHARDAIAAGIERGRHIARGLGDGSSRLNDVVRVAGLSEWRAQALSWRLQQHADPLADLSLVELHRLGVSATADSIDAWGAAALPLTGCLCLAMSPHSSWEDLTGYAAPVLGTYGADVPLRLAETLADLKLPAVLASPLAGFVTQDVIDHAQLGYPDDWQQFGRAVIEIPRSRMSDYVAALAVAGPLIEIK